MKEIKIIKGILVIGFYYLYSYIIYLLLLLLNIDISTMDDSLKVLALITMDIVPVFVLYYIYQKELKKEFVIFKDNFIKFTEENVKYWLLGLVLMSVSNYLITLLTKSEISNNEEIVRSMISVFPLYSIVSIVFIAPFVEEIVFRKTFKEAIKNKYLFIILSGIAFGLIHVISTYETLIDLLYIIPYGIFGSVFAYMYYKTNTIFSSMSMHFIHNSFLLLVYFITHIISSFVG